MDSWDDDEFEVPSLHEPSQVNAAAVTWEDEEEEEEENDQVPKNQDEKIPVDPSKLRPKQLKKLKMKELEEKQRMNQAIARMKAQEQAKETPAERKAREQAAIEEADYENVLDAFAAVDVVGGSSGAGAAAAAGAAVPAPKAGGMNLEEMFDDLKWNTLASHEKYADMIGRKVSRSNAQHALEFLKIVLTKGCANLEADHIKELNTIINVIKNDKIQAAKPKGKKKKQTGKQGFAKVERGANAGGGSAYDDYYDEFDDFM